MQLVHADLMRVQLTQRLDDGRRRQRAARLVAAMRAHRKAEEAAVRARHLLDLSANG